MQFDRDFRNLERVKLRLFLCFWWYAFIKIPVIFSAVFGVNTVAYR